MSLTRDQLIAQVKGETVLLEELDLSGMDLSGIDLTGGVFSEVVFDNVNFSGADLRECKFLNCHLKIFRIYGQ